MKAYYQYVIKCAQTCSSAFSIPFIHYCDLYFPRSSFQCSLAAPFTSAFNSVYCRSALLPVLGLQHDRGGCHGNTPDKEEGATPTLIISVWFCSCHIRRV